MTRIGARWRAWLVETEGNKSLRRASVLIGAVGIMLAYSYLSGVYLAIFTEDYSSLTVGLAVTTFSLVGLGALALIALRLRQRQLIRNNVTHARVDPPRNVRIERASGEVVPIECRYDAYKDGLHHWVAIAPATLHLYRGDQVRVDVLPARTTIHVEMETHDAD